jgi:aryl-alcohol dehydrogenase-like predicted oxidoreductase
MTMTRTPGWDVGPAELGLHPAGGLDDGVAVGDVGLDGNGAIAEFSGSAQTCPNRTSSVSRTSSGAVSPSSSCARVLPVSVTFHHPRVGTITLGFQGMQLEGTDLLTANLAIDSMTKEIAMEYTRLGNTGLKVSRLALGCMSYGDATAARAHRWALDEEASQPFFRQAVEAGITFWDTANTYQLGTSEELVGRAVTRYSRREDVVLATKVFGKMHDGPGGQGLSRKAILEQVDASLTRLGTDYIDLYQIHRFDPETPVEETMEALHDIVKAGKVRYLGASSMYAWQFAKLQHTAALHGWTRFVSMQNQYNLLRRHDERELLPMCADMGVGVVPYSPQGKGRLARPWGEQSHRSTVDDVVKSFDSPLDEPVVNAVQQVAEARGVTMAQVALAWVLRNPVISAPIIGATKPHHLAEAVAALDLHLTADEIQAVEKPYTTHGPAWF